MTKAKRESVAALLKSNARYLNLPLTQNLVTRKLLSRPGRYRDQDMRGLLLCVVGERAASWQLRFEIGRKEKWLGLGSAREFSLKEARERARVARQKLADGIDPLAAKQAERTAQALAAAKSLTFEAAAKQYLAQHEKAWRNRRQAPQFLSSMRAYVFPKLGALSVSAIDVGTVLAAIEENWQTKTETMSRVRRRIEAVLDWATVRGFRSGENPARWRGHLDQVLPARAKVAAIVHHPALAYADLPDFLAQLRAHSGTSARALELAILCAARTGEVLGAKWGEFDLKEGIWVVPAERMKAHREHRVPLSAAALGLLQNLPREAGNDFVFIGSQQGRGLANTALLALLKRMNFNVTTHGFRSSFSDWAHERTSYDNHTIEISLAHKVGSATEKAYRRGDMFDKRRKLMEAWAAYCAQPSKAAGEVVPLRAVAT